MLRRRAAAAPAALVALCLAAAPAAALSPRLLESVVSVVPVWPGYAKKDAGQTRPWEEPEGSGVAVRGGGWLVTSLHVVAHATSVSVRLADGRMRPARIAGGDRATDLAVLKIETDLPPLPFGPAPTLAQPVCTAGNQFGLGLSITCGVVSATNRSGLGFNSIEDFIQTDAVVNPGASGGALVDTEGRLVGVLSAIFTKKSDANLGVNFAASARLVRRVVDDLIAHGRVVRGRPGLRVADLPVAARHDRVGAVIRRVAPGGAAATAGLRAGDVITAIGARPILKASDVTAEVHMYRPGESFAVTVFRDGAPQTLSMTLAR